MFDLEPQYCQPSHGIVNVLLAVFVVVGLFASYVPQQVKILRNKTSEGFSPWFLLLGSLACLSSLLNVLVLQWPVLQCCRFSTPGRCFLNLLGILQVSVQWVLLVAVLVLFIVYFPAHRKMIYFSDATVPHAVPSYEWRLSKAIALVVASHLLVFVGVSVYLLLMVGGPQHTATKWWAGALGVLGMIMSILQYIPPIRRTWKRKSVGALSIPMMLTQTPATFLLAYSLFLQPGTNWSSWVGLLVSGVLQSVLLILSIAWYQRARRLRMYAPILITDDEDEEEHLNHSHPYQRNEREPLIRASSPESARGSSNSRRNNYWKPSPARELS
ncbi:hypothetical protein K493DRAFT_315863 [Basidiobolus meristosporus CBS 931.73]|uniref:PQ-loop-domain-containing protein n=1 Tax=Basidiobolus meristosporus CBS 931.73 TaxID=1314790 RepID=A0A1Y1Y6M7_9FUNG|nr:hypothetical protein K493DRAFT_315863 [Basidiobolus meristosporus CBS 931.73]|eukprot:ORX93681.1 hypothetical protein K493DRAFT_315863 [Basidiobolus meristosporus CBS 931.73]